MIELIIVIAIIAVIVSTVFVALDPAGRLEQAHLTSMNRDMQQLQKAIELYIADHQQFPSAQTPPDHFLSRQPVCKYGVTAACMNLDPLIDGGYMPMLPQGRDVSESADHIGYAVYMEGAHPHVTAPSRPHALDLSGISYFSVPDADGAGSDLSAAQPFTISAWIKPFSNPSPVTYFVKRDDPPERGYILYAFFNGVTTVIRFQMSTDGSNYRRVTRTGALPLNTYSHVAVTYDPGTSSLKMYVNGAEEGVATTNGILGTIASSQSFTFPFDGLLDDVRIFDAALSAVEIATLYGGGDVAGAVNHWAFDEGGPIEGGNYAIDYGEGEEHTALTGPLWTEDVAPPWAE